MGHIYSVISRVSLFVNRINMEFHKTMNDTSNVTTYRVMLWNVLNNLFLQLDYLDFI